VLYGVPDQVTQEMSRKQASKIDSMFGRYLPFWISEWNCSVVRLELIFKHQKRLKNVPSQINDSVTISIHIIELDKKDSLDLLSYTRWSVEEVVGVVAKISSGS
jgi:hypothetical protein